MRYLIILIMALIPFQSIAGVGGGGVGPRPTMFSRQNADLVRTLEINRDKATFLYKPFDGPRIEMKTIEVIDIDDRYLQALIDSQRINDWMTISFQE